MIKKRFRLLFIILTLGFPAICVAQKKIFNTISQRINQDIQVGIEDEALARKVIKSMLTLKSDGSFSDIDYQDAEYNPLNRIKEFAIAYVRPQNKFFKDSRLKEIIISCLQNWYDQNPGNKNWWFNDIFYPQTIGEVLLTLRNSAKSVPVTLENNLINRMKRPIKPNDNANTSDEALHYLYRACLTESTSTLDSAVRFLYQPIIVHDGSEGLQVDGSYHQHGEQQAIASYGRVFLNNSVDAGWYLRDTPYQLSAGQFKIISDFFENTILKSIRGSFLDFNVKGRGIARRDSLRGNVVSIAEKFKELNPKYKNYWDAPVLRISNAKPANYKVQPGNIYYWKSDYNRHNRSGFTFSVQASSIRTLRTEKGNRENIYGNFLADGATNIQQSGSEYANIMPIWEWDKIPGTTSRDYTDDQGAVIKKDWGIRGTTSFTGGVSDGVYGAGSYFLNHDSVQAKKAWFFFDNQVVCLGAGISSKANEEITTTINQTWLRTDVNYTEVSNNKTSPLANDQLKTSSFKTVTHDDITYAFPNGGNITVSNKIQKNSWYRINNALSRQEVKGNVFKVWINHGKKPKNADYVYVVVPNKYKTTDVEHAVKAVSIIANNDSLQAVYHNDLDILQAVFYQPTSLSYKNLLIEVNGPCIIEITALGTNSKLFVSDPTQKLAELKIEIRLPKSDVKKTILCDLPKGAMSGMTTSYELINK